MPCFSRLLRSRGSLSVILPTLWCGPIPSFPLSASTDRRPFHYQIEEGDDVYLVPQLTGHSLEILVRHYDRCDIKKRSAEATASTYAKKKQDDKCINF